ncbi:MAG TPA: glucuronate isomerase [Gemmatimonadaceae bacterium]|nr:glucuronate isomerase [Gemmatimonadaceae bacterium]
MRSRSSSTTKSLPQPLQLEEDRFFDPDPATRRVARAIYDDTRGLPLLCPHGHVDAVVLAGNRPFPEPTALLIVPDHYIFRMLYSRGVSLDRLGIPRSDGSRADADPREVWQTFADHWYLFRGTPTGAWLDHELYDLFEVRVKLDGGTAGEIYDQILGKLRSPEFLPRTLFDRFGIEVLATTDAATDSLDDHLAIRNSGWDGNVIPTFRPDALFRLASPKWADEIAALGKAVGFDVTAYSSFVSALEERRAFFRSAGATATDHGVLDPYTEKLSDAEAEKLFDSALRGTASPADQLRFEAHMLVESARMSVDDGMVMQLHPGALRDHNKSFSDRFGPDKGADIPVSTEYTRNLAALLNAYGNDPRLTLVVFTLDESTYARELAPLAGHYPALRIGPPWWFHDSIQGMIRYRESITETAGIYNTVGFNDDTRAFCSIPARHDLSRRVDANWLAGLVARHVIDMSDAREMGRALAYDLAREAYKLDTVIERAPEARQSGPGAESAA